MRSIHFDYILVLSCYRPYERLIIVRLDLVMFEITMEANRLRFLFDVRNQKLSRNCVSFWK